MISRKKSLLTLAGVAILSLALLAADGKYPRVEKLAEQALKVELPLQEAINKVMEEYGGIPISAGLEKHDRGGSGSVFWVVTVRPAKEGMPATVWAHGIDANSALRTTVP